VRLPLLEHYERMPTGHKLTLHYLLQTESHVFAFSMAANVLLAFFPFLVVMLSLCRYVFRWRGAEQAIYLAMGDYFPGDMGTFIVANLQAGVGRAGAMHITSMLLLLFTANGIFEPLEVALNRAWGIAKNRSFVHNQIVSLGMIFLTGTLVLSSALLTAFNQEMLSPMGLNFLLGPVLFKLAAVPLSIIALFLIYWLLPNGRVPIRPLIPVAVAVGLALELMKWVVLAVWPWLWEKFNVEYGPFKNSALIVFLSFIASMIVLAGAEWAARSRKDTATP